MLHLFYLFLVSNKYKYILLQVISAFIFALLYYIQDILMIKYNDFMVKYKLGGKITDLTFNGFIYYLWLSFITQTTVGYIKITDSHGKTVSFVFLKSKLYKLLSIFQLITILILPIFVL
jgi:hypothetical protein